MQHNVLLGLAKLPPTNMFGVNTASISMADEMVDSSRTKHIAIKYHFVRDLIKMGEMLVWFVKTRDNLSDILTKALGTVLHKEIRDKISAGDPNGNLRTEMMETFNLLDNRSKDTKYALTCMILQSCLNETRMIFRQD